MGSLRSDCVSAVKWLVFCQGTAESRTPVHSMGACDCSLFPGILHVIAVRISLSILISKRLLQGKTKEEELVE